MLRKAKFEAWTHGNACRIYTGISGFSAGSLSGLVSFALVIKWRIMYIMLNKVSDQVSQSFSFALHASYQAYNAFHLSHRSV